MNIHVHGAQGYKTLCFQISVTKLKNLTGNLTNSVLFLAKKGGEKKRSQRQHIRIMGKITRKKKKSVEK